MEVRLNARAAAVFQNVTKVYPGGWRRPFVQALDGVSLSVGWGEVFGLIGPNRAGKTTLVKILLSIARPTSGRIMRLESGWADRGTLAQVGYVHENPAFPNYLTARQLLDGYGRMSGVVAAELAGRRESLLERVGLADRSRERIATYSKGMLQRLALAQALINRPRLLVLDEPSEGMDLSARKLLHEVIAEQRSQGNSVILVSHALADVHKLCDRVAVLRAGQLAYCGPTGDLTAPKLEPTHDALESAVEPLYEGALA